MTNEQMLRTSMLFVSKIALKRTLSILKNKYLLKKHLTVQDGGQNFICVLLNKKAHTNQDLLGIHI
jgi:hypothetical protein